MERAARELGRLGLRPEQGGEEKKGHDQLGRRKEQARVGRREEMGHGAGKQGHAGNGHAGENGPRARQAV